MTKKEILQGFIIGLLTTSIGVFIASIFLGKFSGKSDQILEVLKAAQSEGFLGKLIS